MTGEYQQGYVKASLEDIKGRLERIEKKIDIQNGRIGKTEKKLARIMGIGSVLVIIVPIIIREVFK